MIAAILPVLGTLIGKVLDSVFPNAEDQLKRAQIEASLQAAIIEQAGAIERAASDIVLAEARGDGWLQKNWRPLTMLTFVGLIVARFLGFGAPGMTEAEYLAVWDLMQLGLGGYVIGRSAEKLAPSIVRAMGK